MDFCQLLHKAKKNDQNNGVGSRYYSTKYEPPKKIKKEKKDLSESVKRFLAKKEEEERKKQAVDKRKRDELLALRAQDKKATRRVNVMLKRTKSANQSVIEDAVDNTHTAVTRAGPEQPDEDDYGYVSQEATALYEKMMEKYSQIPEEPKFNLFKKKVSTNLSSTKDRVKAALEKEKEEAMQPRKRKRKKRTEDGQEVEEEIEDKDESSNVKHGSSKEEQVPKPKPKPRAAPPPMSFTEILKLAAQKQHEPIVIEAKPQEEEKLYTKKQRKELEQEREYRERRERRDREREQLAPKTESRILEKELTKPLPSSSNKTHHTSEPQRGQKLVKKSENPSQKHDKVSENSSGSRGPISQSSLSKSGASSLSMKRDDVRKLTKYDTSCAKNGIRKEMVPVKKKNGDLESSKKVFNGKPKEFPPRDLIPKNKPKPTSPKQFPPPDVRGVKRKQLPVSRGRILDDDDEEYDSEMDDFIDDDPQEGDYSKYIKEIFGYDRGRYKDRDDDIDDMETSFAQQMKEEVISTKIGIMEDLEDMKKEEEEKKRKAMLKKKMRR